MVSEYGKGLDAEETLRYLPFMTFVFLETRNIFHTEVAVIVVVLLLFRNH